MESKKKKTAEIIDTESGMVVSRGWGWREMGRFEGIRNHMGNLDLYSHLTIIRSLCSSPSIWGRVIESLVVGQDFHF